MKKIIKDNKPYNIDCEDNMCGNCNFKPTSGVNCELFNLMLDHAVSGFDKNSGWQRCSKCKNAEVK